MTFASSDDQPMWLRIIRYPLVRLAVLGPIIFVMMMQSNTFLATYNDRPLVLIPITIAMGLAVIAVYYAYGRIVEGREVTELSAPGMLGEWAIGALIGGGLITACVVVMFVLGLYHVEGLNPVSVMVPTIAMAISSGTFEELFFRGVLYKSVEDLAGSWIAIVISSLVFGFVHLLNPAGTIVGAIYITIEAGLLLAAVYLLTRRLWIGMGVHMMWNYTQSAVFSSIVSGSDAAPGLLKATFTGPDLLTGGSFGIESSIFALLFCTGAGIVSIILAMRRGHLVPAPWTR